MVDDRLPHGVVFDNHCLHAEPLIDGVQSVFQRLIAHAVKAVEIDLRPRARVDDSNGGEVGRVGNVHPGHVGPARLRPVERRRCGRVHDATEDAAGVVYELRV